MFFAPHSPIFWIRPTEKQKEQDRQLQSVMHFTQKQYFFDPYCVGPKWRYFLSYAVKMASVICLSMRV